MRASLRHADDLPELDFPVTGGWRFFSEQLGGDPQRFYLLFDSQYFLFFCSEYVKGILHRRAPSSAIKTNYQSGTDSKL
jgi:hypothetical protein